MYFGKCFVAYFVACWVACSVATEQRAGELVAYLAWAGYSSALASCGIGGAYSVAYFAAAAVAGIAGKC